MDTTYKCYVVFERDLSDDQWILEEKYPHLSLEEAAKRQLAHELQEACDEIGLAGFFNVEKVEIPEEIK